MTENYSYLSICPSKWFLTHWLKLGITIISGYFAASYLFRCLDRINWQTWQRLNFTMHMTDSRPQQTNKTEKIFLWQSEFVSVPWPWSVVMCRHFFVECSGYWLGHITMDYVTLLWDSETLMGWVIKLEQILIHEETISWGLQSLKLPFITSHFSPNLLPKSRDLCLTEKW